MAPGTIARFYSALFGPEKGAERMTPEDREADADPSLKDVYERLAAAEPKKRARTVALMRDPKRPAERIRVYDTETDADDAAARVLLALGRNPSANGESMFSLYSPTAKEACIAAIASGQILQFDPAEDHPNVCWRYFHAKQLERAFASCPSSGLTPRAHAPRPVPERTSPHRGGVATSD